MSPEARTTFRAQAMANREQLYPGSITLGGTPYDGTLSIQSEPITNEDGGQRMGDVLTFRLPKSRRAEQPAERSTLTSQGKTWIISTVGGKQAWADEWIIKAIQ